MLLALPKLGSEGRDLFAVITPSQSIAVFVIAIAGWMPMPMTGSIFLSMWAREKKALGGDLVNHQTAIADLRCRLDTDCCIGHQLHDYGDRDTVPG